MNRSRLRIPRQGKLKIVAGSISVLFSLLFSVNAAAVSVIASSDNDMAGAERTLDNNLATRWSTKGDGQWIAYDLGSNQAITQVNIAFHRGDERANSLDIQASSDNVNWQTVFSGTTSQFTLATQAFDFTDTYARYVRIIGRGNSTNRWNSFTEVGFETDADADALAGGVVTVYQHCNYGGYSVNLAPGSYSLTQLLALGVGNDDLSSIRVSEGYDVKLYQDIFSGSELVKTSDDNCFIDDNYNDVVSSLVISTATNPSIQLAAADVVGSYRTAAPTNGWHSGNIVQTTEGLRWQNDAGISWQLGLDANSRLLTVSSDYPYIANDHHEITLADGSSNSNPIVESIDINFSNYQRQRASDPFAGTSGDSDPSAFYAYYGGESEFSDKTRFVLEAFIEAEDLYYAGKYQEAKAVVDGVWALYPVFSSSSWTSNFVVPAAVQLGVPQVYAPLRMLDEAIQYRLREGVREPAYTVMHTIVELDCIDAVIPGSEEELEAGIGTFERRRLSRDLTESVYRQSYRLFGEFLEAMTDGELGYDIQVVRLAPDICLNGTINSRFSTLQQYAIQQYLDDSVNEVSDFYSTVYPSIDPDLQRATISGGQGGFRGKPVLIANDQSYLRKHPRFGADPWFDVERRAYLPRWVQHEMFHYLFSNFPEFQLEETGHQWFDRSTWPDDFEGFHEIDYYHEAYLKRFRSASPSLAERLKLRRESN